ncbi:MAG: DMT family transporter [Chitinophagaceae bacterium]
MNPRKAHIAVIAANLIFGINFSVVQYITHLYVGPFALNILRVGITTLLLWSLWLGGDSPLGIEKKDVLRFLLCAITGVVINQSLFIQGLSLTLSIHASLLILVTPVFISVAASLTGTESMSGLKWLGLLIAIGGAALLSFSGKESGDQASAILWGDLLIILNAISYAIYFSLVKPLIKKYPTLHVIRWVFTMGLLFMVPIGWTQLEAVQWSSLSGEGVAGILFIVLGATFGAYLFNLYGIKHLGASVTGTYIYTQPLFASLIALFLLGEHYTLTKGLAAAFIITGVLLANRNSSKTEPVN